MALKLQKTYHFEQMGAVEDTERESKIESREKLQIPVWEFFSSQALVQTTVK